MSRKRLIVLCLGCCSVLSCEAGSQKSLKTATERPDGAAAVVEKSEASDAPRVPEDWARRVLSETKRVDAQTARLAVSSVAGVAPRPLLRLDTVLLGAGEWPVTVLSHSGLTVRRQETYLLVDTSRADGMKPALRETLLPIHAAIERVRENLLTHKVIGQRGVTGELERLLPSSTAAASANGATGVLVDFTQGPITETGQALDLAIQGQGVFVLEYQDGAQARQLYTRDGRFKLRKDGAIVSRAFPQAKLVPEVMLQPDTTQVAVSTAGAILARTKMLQLLGDRGRITLAWFEHPERLAQVRPGFFARTPEAGRVIEGKPTEGTFGSLQQGSVEGSNINYFDNWSRLCLLEDARQLVLAMLTEVEDASGSGVRLAETGEPASGSRAPSMRISPTVLLPRQEPRYDASEPTLLTFLRLRGTDVWVGENGLELQRNPETAAALVQYLKFLRIRLDVLAENVANSSRRDVDAGKAGPYRRKRVQLRDDGDAEVIEDTSPPRVVREAAASETGNSGGQALLVEYPNVDVEGEMAESDAVAREYRAVREAVQEMGGDAVPALTEMLRSGPAEMRLDAACALGQIGSEASAAVPALIEALSCNDWDLRESATGALQRIAPDSTVVVEAIVRTWTSALRTTDGRRRYEAATTLGRMGAKAAAAVPVLAEMLSDPTSGAARSLGQMGKAAAPAVPALMQALQHREVYVRQQAADALGRIGAGARPAVPALIQAMSDGNADVRWRAAAAIGSIGSNDSGCVAALAALLKDEDADVRDRVAEALGRLGSPSSELQGLLETAAKAERARDGIWPAFALAITGQRPASFVLSLGNILLTDERATRLAACEALTRLGPLASPAVPVLTELLSGRDKAVVAAAMDALGAIGPAAAPAVSRLTIGLSDRDPFLRRRAAVALGHIGEGAAAAAPALVAQLTDTSEPVVVACAEALGMIGPQAAEARAALKNLQQHRSAAVRGAVAVSLNRIDDTPDRRVAPGTSPTVAAEAVAGSAEGTAEQ